MIKQRSERKVEVATIGQQDAIFGGFGTSRQTGFAGWLLDLTRWWRQRELRGRRQQAQRQLTIVETLPLGPRKELVLVSCAGERFLSARALKACRLSYGSVWIVSLKARTRSLRKTGGGDELPYGVCLVCSPVDGACRCLPARGTGATSTSG